LTKQTRHMLRPGPPLNVFLTEKPRLSAQSVGNGVGRPDF